MTGKERIAFIRDKIAPIFNDMNAEDVWDTLHDAWANPEIVFSRFTV